MAPDIAREVNPLESAANEVPNTGVRALLEELSAIDLTDQASANERLKVLEHLARAKAFPSLEPILPLVLNLNGRPYDIRDHFPFAPLFRVLMPKNQVWKTGRQLSKSTSLAAHGVVLANSVPFFKTLYVTPLFEQIRRFSNNYVRSFIEQSPLKNQWMGTDTENNVLQRTFKNKSMMLFSFALLDADRCRGISADRIAIDESIRFGTLVSTPNGARPVESLVSGDVVLAFDANGAIHEDQVVKCSDHGVRECFRFEFADGSVVEATGDSFISTTAGWRRVSTVIEDFYAAAVAADSGHVAGRWLPQPSALLQSTRVRPARLQQGEVPDIVRVRTVATQETEEQRLRKLVECLVHRDLTAIAPYSGYVLPRRQEDRNGRMAAPADLGSHCLVVSGRREPGEEKPDGRVSYRRPGQTERVSVGGVVAEPRDCGEGAYASPQGAYRAISCNSPDSSRDPGSCGKNPPVRGAADAVQNRTAAVAGDADLSLVRPEVYAADDEKNRQESALLREQGLRTGAPLSQQREVHGAPRSSQSEKRATSGGVLQQFRTEPRTCESDVGSVARAQPRQGERSQETGAGQETSGAGCETLDLSVLRADRAARRQKLAIEVLPELPREGDRRDQAPVCCEASAIVKITCTGKHRVFDIETAKHHTFFAGGVAVHNCQDLDPSHIPVIAEAMSYSKFAMSHYTGTPKSLDNPLEGLYQRSSGAEWFIPCHSCKHWNIPSREHDLDAMIGPYRDDISEKAPGTVCAKCRKPICPRHGRWVHRHPERRWSFAGYHVPQLLLPLHYGDPDKWSTLLMKREGYNYTQAQFYNEVLGESIDAGQKLVSETDLRNACLLPWENKREPEARCFENLDEYKHRILAIDWGGGGEEGVSFTALAVLGFRPDGTIDVIWGKRLSLGGEHLAEAVECMKWSQKFRCDFVVHDYTGAGAVRETVMVQAGFNLDRVMAIRLVRSASQDYMVYKEPTAINHRAHYSLDKTRSLLYTCQAIKLQQVRFFQYDWVAQDNPGLVADFLSLIENKVESKSSSDIYTITRNVLLSDDWAQAVNFGVSAAWYINQSFPNFAEIAGLGRLSAQVVAAENPEDWADDDTANRFFGY